MATRRPNRYNAARDKGDEAQRIAHYHAHKSIAGPTRTWSLPLWKLARWAVGLLIAAYIIGSL